MKLIIQGKEIFGNIADILKRVKSDTGRDLFKEIRISDDNIITNCPRHKNGRENNPSCNIYNSKTNRKVTYGTVHCFTCGYTAPLYKMIGDCFYKDEEFGKQWLIKNFSIDSSDRVDILPPIEISPSVSAKIDISQYDYYHQYMWDRHLTKDVVDKFYIGYNKKRDTITFPVWNERGELVMVTERSVTSKKFYIESGETKPVYLLNFVIKEGHTKVYVCESQINCLTLWSWGYPAVALFGTGTKHQYDILNKSGIREYVLCLDGDSAGDSGIDKFKNHINKECLVSIKKMPRDGRDVNDLTKEEFENLKII